MTWQLTSELSSYGAVKCLVYGVSGIGKTTLCGTAPKPVILAAEPGLLVLKGKQIPFKLIKTVQDLEAAYRDLTSPQWADAYSTICIDNLTEIAEVVLLNAKAQVKDPRQAYGEVLEQTMRCMRAFRDIPGKHVVVLAQEEAHKEEASGMMQRWPMMPGNKLPQQISRLFDLVMRMYEMQGADGSKHRVLQTQPSSTATAKCRSDKLNEVEYPDLTEIFRKMLET